VYLAISRLSLYAMFKSNIELQYSEGGLNDAKEYIAAA
jgi:hypothetical protein